MQGVERHHAAAEVEGARQLAHRRDLVGLVAHLDLPQHQPGAVLDRGDHHAALAVGLLRSAAHVLPVQRHRCRSVAALACPRAQRPVQRVGRQRRQDVVEGGGRRRGVAPPARAEERARRLQLLLVHPRRELPERGHPPVARQPRGDHDRRVAGQPVAPPARLAEVRHVLQERMQAAQLGRRRRQRPGPGPPVPGQLRAAQRRRRVLLHLVHVHLLRPTVLPPARRPARFPRIAARAPQRHPVRRPVAGAGEPRRVHERLRQQHRVPVRVPHVPRQPAQAQPERPRRQVRNPALLQHREAGVVRDQVQPRELLLARPADPRVADSHLEGPRLPAQQRQPGLPPHRHVPQRLAEQAAEGQVVVLRHQRVPAPPLLDAAHRATSTPRSQRPDLSMSRLSMTPLLPQRLLNGQRQIQPRRQSHRQNDF